MMNKILALVGIAAAMIATPAAASECCKTTDPSYKHAAGSSMNAGAGNTNAAVIVAKGKAAVAADDPSDLQVARARKMKAYFSESGIGGCRAQPRDVKCHDCKKVKLQDECKVCTQRYDREDCDGCSAGQCAKAA